MTTTDEKVVLVGKNTVIQNHLTQLNSMLLFLSFY